MKQSNLLKNKSARKPWFGNKDAVAKQVGVGAVIFHDLKNDRLNTFDFNLEEVVRFEGETGPYVQYTHARAVSLLEKQDLSLQKQQTMHWMTIPAGKWLN